MRSFTESLEHYWQGMSTDISRSVLLMCNCLVSLLQLRLEGAKKFSKYCYIIFTWYLLAFKSTVISYFLPGTF